jgi:hypothetical protein
MEKESVNGPFNLSKKIMVMESLALQQRIANPQVYRLSLLEYI